MAKDEIQLPLFPPKRLYRLPQVLELIPVSKSTLWQWIKDGRFPKGIKISNGITAWDAETVHKYINDMVQEAAE